MEHYSTLQRQQKHWNSRNNIKSLYLMSLIRCWQCSVLWFSSWAYWASHPSSCRADSSRSRGNIHRAIDHQECTQPLNNINCAFLLSNAAVYVPPFIGVEYVMPTNPSFPIAKRRRQNEWGRHAAYEKKNACFRATYIGDPLKEVVWNLFVLKFW